MQVDVTNYTEIATHNVEDRRVLDLAVDQLDNSLAVITRETENFNQQARIYDIGRVRYPVQSCKPHTGYLRNEALSRLSPYQLSAILWYCLQFWPAHVSTASPSFEVHCLASEGLQPWVGSDVS